MDNDNKIKSSKIRIILRWIAVIPVAVAGLLVGLVLVGLFGKIQGLFLGINPDSGYAKLFDWVFAPFWSSVLSVYSAIKVAPSQKKIVAIITTVLIVIFSVISFLISFSVGTYWWLWPLLGSISMITGASYVMHSVYEKGKFDL